jgi:hypothetical protein
MSKSRVSLNEARNPLDVLLTWWQQDTAGKMQVSAVMMSVPQRPSCKVLVGCGTAMGVVVVSTYTHVLKHSDELYSQEPYYSITINSQIL